MNIKEYDRNHTDDHSCVDEEGNQLLDTIIRNEDDEEVLDRAVEVMNLASGVSGEEYVIFKEIVDRVRNEMVLDYKQISIFHNNNSTGMTPRTSLFSEITKMSQLFRKYFIENQWKYVYTYKDNSWQPLNSKKDIIKSIRQFVYDRHCTNYDWPNKIYMASVCYEDYWGNYPSFRGKLKPIDFARCFADVVYSLGKFMHYVSEQPHLKGGGYNYYEPNFKVEEIDLYDVEKFLENYINWYKDNDKEHVYSLLVDLYKDLVDADNYEDYEKSLAKE